MVKSIVKAFGAKCVLWHLDIEFLFQMFHGIVQLVHRKLGTYGIQKEFSPTRNFDFGSFHIRKRYGIANNVPPCARYRGNDQYIIHLLHHFIKGNGRGIVGQ